MMRLVKEIFKRSLVYVGIKPVVRYEWVKQNIALRIFRFAFIRYGKTCRYRNDCHEERSFLYSQIPRNRRLIPCRATWGNTRSVRRQRGQGKM